MKTSRKKSLEVSGQLNLFSQLGLDSSLETKIDRSSNSGGAYGFSALPGGNRNNNGNFNITHEASEATKLVWAFPSRLGKRSRNEGNNDNANQN